MDTHENTLVYRNFPLVRQGNVIYYGNVTDKYIIMLQIIDTEKHKDLEIANKVTIQLQHTDPEIKSKYRISKQSEKKGLYSALDLAHVWLERALS